MAPTQKDLLAAAKAVDTQQQSRMAELADKVAEISSHYDVPFNPHPIEQLKLEADDADPFNGNLNNRRVAARIAARREVTSGDPIKAKADVEKSLRVNPEPVVTTGDELPEIKLVPSKTPTPGSPAAAKADASKGKGKAATTTTEPAQQATGTDATAQGTQPPQWKPNA